MPALLATGAAGSVGERFLRAVSALRGGGCSAGGRTGGPRAADKDSEPPLCTLSTVTDRAGSTVELGSLEWGSGYGFQEKVHQAEHEVNGDGDVDGADQLIHATCTDTASSGVTGGLGGRTGEPGEGSVDLGAGIRVNNGDTWVFESRSPAQGFRDALETLRMYGIRRTSPCGAEAGPGDSILYLFGTGPLHEGEQIRARSVLRSHGR
ncbi:hypothetical protein [Streptomyces sp. CC210A]|uniref:hypothetical protein n=1 Tax=Streptomyces sp. CC210A TaxID=2898184 RepID=UPI001F22AD91|nr:hypothetical protein [Streptomyces sp. CC210A]